MVGNSHLQGETTMVGDTSPKVSRILQAVASMAGLPVACITAPHSGHIQRETRGQQHCRAFPMAML